MTIQDLPRHIHLKTTMTLHPKKQTGAHRVRPSGLHTLRGTPCGLAVQRFAQGKVTTHVVNRLAVCSPVDRINPDINYPELVES
jgi:hypothetical protein